MNNEKIFRILIADDNQTSRKGLSALLNAFSRKQEHEMEIEIVGEAEDGQEAVTLAHELSPDLIFMDIKMPHLDGLEATKIIKEALKDVKIVILSMHSDKREAAFKSGADEFLVKGTDTQIIKQVLWRFIPPKEKGD